MVVEPFRLHEYLVRVPVGEAHDLVFDRRAIARAGAFDLPGIERRAVEIVADQIMARRGGAGDMTRHLGRGDGAGQRRERFRRVVAGLRREALPIDGPAVQAGRRAGLQPAEMKAKPGQGLRQSKGGRLADPAGRRGGRADMDEPAQEGPGGQDDRPAGDLLTRRGDHPGDAPFAIEKQVLDASRFDAQVILLRQQPLHGLAVETAVGLGARPLHGGPLGTVQHAKLDAGAVDGAPHDPVEGVDLAHQMALAETADGGVAGHLADGVGPVGHQQGRGAHARGRRRSLGAGMAAADDDDVVCRMLFAHGRDTLPGPFGLSKQFAARFT